MRLLTFVFGLIFGLGVAQAQQGPLTFNTVERPPFSFQETGEATGFSIDLMKLIAEQLGREVQFTYSDSFPDMLAAVESGSIDGAVANISITSDREAVMDFSQPIFEAGLQIMVSGDGGGPSIWRALFSVDLVLAVLAAFAVLFLLGLLMWLFERGKQPYFDRPAKQALFPSFWWALNLVVNGGFEERMPQSVVGRFLGVLMVISSLFIVSIFVANITATLTLEAITGSIQSLDDLEGRKVATTEGSTASSFLAGRDIPHRTYESYAALIEAFEGDDLDAVIFDGPILAHYVNTSTQGDARLIERVFRPENYGIALPQGSELRESINRALLDLNESGRYNELVVRWFGVAR